MTLNLWTRIFCDDSYAEVETAVLAYACRDTKGFAPPIGAIKALIWEQRNEALGEQAAWELVKRQLSGSSVCPSENFGRLPLVVQDCVGSPSTLMKWGQMNADELESVIGSGFKRNYREAVSRRRAWEVLPREIQTRFPIANTGENLEANETAKLAGNGEWNGTPCPLEVKQLIETIRKKDAALEK